MSTRIRFVGLLALILVVSRPCLGHPADAPADKVEKTNHQRQSWYANEPAPKKHSGNCGCIGCYARPYKTSSCLYGYQDFAYGRGPVVDLGGATLQPGFRGFGVLGSPGYGQGLYPTSDIDRRAAARGWKLIP